MGFLDPKIFERPEERRRPRASPFIVLLAILAILPLSFSAGGVLTDGVSRAGALAAVGASESRGFFTDAFCRWLALGCPSEPEYPVQEARSATRDSALPAPTAPVPVATTTIVYQTIQQNPVVERVVERIVSAPVSSAPVSGLSQALLDSRLAELERSFSSRLAALASSASANTSAVYRVVGEMGRIGRLDDVTITNATITGGSVAAASVSGTLTNALDSLSGAIASLTGTELSYTRATFTDATTTNLAVTGSATSSFAGGLSALRLTASATSTLSGLVVDGSGLRLSLLDCSAYGNGGTLTTDASGNVICATDDGGAGSTVAGSDTQVQWNQGGAFGAAPSFTFASSSARLTVTNASTTAFSSLWASSTSLFAGTLALTNALSAQYGGTGIASPAAAGVLLGSYAGGSWQQLATSSLGLLTTHVSEGTNLYYTPERVAGVLAGTTTDAIAQGSANRYYSSLLFAADLAGTTTTALPEGANKYYTDARVGSYISGSSTVPHIPGSAFGDLLSWSGSGWATRATSTLALITSDLVEGANLFFTNARVLSYLDSLDKGYFFSTTSADAWKGTRDFFSTTSVAYWETTQARWATTSADHWLTGKTTDDLAEGANKYYSDSLVSAYIHASTTVPKTYTANAWSALQSFAAASTTRISVFDRLYVGGSATTTILGSATSTFGAGVQASALSLTGSATSTFANGLRLSGGCIEVNGACVGGATSQWTSLASDIYYSLGAVSIGTTTPGRTLTVFNTAANAQQRISYDAARYAELYVDAAGDFHLSATGKSIRASDANIYLCDGGACPTTPVQGYPSSFTTNGNLVAGGTVYAGGFGPATCPSGMIPVPASAADGQPGFCVDKYETQSSGGNAVSVQGGSPWVSITQYDARAQCRRAGKHLIRESEWQAIAHNIENVGWNWNGGVAGTNQMSDGHSDNSPASALATAADSSPCSGTGQTCDLSTWNSQRRVYKLSNGEYIWDFGGNVWEWVDEANQEDYPIANSGTAGWQACSTSGDGICGNTRTTNDQWYRGQTTALRGFIRGGSWGSGADSGAFTLNLNNAPSNSGATVGFRCAR